MGRQRLQLDLDIALAVLAIALILVISFIRLIFTWTKDGIKYAKFAFSGDYSEATSFPRIEATPFFKLSILLVAITLGGWIGLLKNANNLGHMGGLAALLGLTSGLGPAVAIYFLVRETQRYRRRDSFKHRPSTAPEDARPPDLTGLPTEPKDLISCGVATPEKPSATQESPERARPPSQALPAQSQDLPGYGMTAPEKSQAYFFVGFIVFGVGCIPFLLYFFGPDPSTHSAGALLAGLAIMAVGAAGLYAGRSRVR